MRAVTRAAVVRLGLTAVVLRREGRSSDRGSGSVLVLAVCLVVLLVAMGALSVSGVVLAGHRARAAADLAALTGAARVRDGLPGEACAAAGQVARANGATLDGCRVAGEVVELRVRVAVPGRLGAARADARAGPGQHEAPP